MTRIEFLKALALRLEQLPPDERERRVAYYAELLADMVEDGIDEAEAVARMGDPAELAAEILREQPLNQLIRSRVRPGGGWTALTVILLVLGSPVWLPLLLAIAVVLLAVYIVFWSLILVAFAVVLAIGLGGVGLLLALFWGGGKAFSLVLLLLGGFLLCAGLAVFAFLGAVAVAKGLVKLSARVARGVKSCFIRKGV